MAKNYSLNETQDFRKVRTEVLVASIIALLSIIVGGYIYFDIAGNSVVIDESNNKPSFSRVEDTSTPMELKDEQLFTIEIPKNWKRTRKPFLVDSRQYQSITYYGDEGEEQGRSIDIFVDEIPAKLGVAKILVVSNLGNRVTPVETSQQCYTFTDYEEQFQGDDFPSKWNNIPFTCKTSQYSNEIAALETSQEDGIVLNGEEGGEHAYLIVYTDHGSNTNNSLFFDIIKTLRAK